MFSCQLICKDPRNKSEDDKAIILSQYFALAKYKSVWQSIHQPQIEQKQFSDYTKHMENKNEYQAQLFSNRLKKKYKELRKWARKNRISCYRLYDRDIPEIPVSLDLYEFLPSDVTTPSSSTTVL